MLILYILVFLLILIINKNIKKGSTTLFDVHLLIGILYFSVWPILSSFSNNDSFEGVPVFIFLCTMITSLIFFNSLEEIQQFKKISHYLRLHYYINLLRGSSEKYLIILYLLTFLSQLVIYSKFGVIKNYDTQALAQGQITIPSFYLLLLSTIRYSLFLILTGLFVKYIYTKRIRYVIAICSIVPLIFLHGKAALVIAFVVLFIIYSTIRKRSLFCKGNFLIGFILGLFFLISFNFFQTIRSGLISPSDMDGSSYDVIQSKIGTKSLSDMLVFDDLVDVIATRPSVDRFNKLVYKMQFQNSYESFLPLGRIFIYAHSMLIPRSIWNDKPRNDVQKYMLFPFYNQKYEVFQAPSVYGYIFADFSILVIVLYPLLLFLLGLATTYISFILPLPYRSWVSVTYLYNMLSIEANYDSYALILRNVLIFSIPLIILYASKITKP